MHLLNRFMHQTIRRDLKKATWREIRLLRGIGNYQFGKTVGDALFRGRITVSRSRTTHGIRHIYKDRKLLATLRPSDGNLALTLFAAQCIAAKTRNPPSVVTVQRGVEPFVEQGRSVFAKHVAKADPKIHPKDEVIVLDDRGKVLAVGRAILSGEEMLHFKVGVAVKVRSSIGKRIE